MASHREGIAFGHEPEHLQPEPAARVARPLFSWGLFAVCVVCFLPQLVQPGAEMAWSVRGPDVAAGEWWRVLTAQVMHHGPVHLAVNCISILGFGPFIERRVGSLRLGLASLLAGVLSSAFALAFSWEAYTAGASGMIIGWLGMGIPIVEPRWRRVLLQWTLFNVLLSLNKGISWAGHLGGFVAGLVSGALMRRSDAVVPPRRFGLFDRLYPLLLASAVAAVILVVRFHSSGG